MKKIRKGLYTSKDEMTRIEKVGNQWEWESYNAEDQKISGKSETKSQAMSDIESAWWTPEFKKIYESL